MYFECIETNCLISFRPSGEFQPFEAAKQLPTATQYAPVSNSQAPGKSDFSNVDLLGGLESPTPAMHIPSTALTSQPSFFPSGVIPSTVPVAPLQATSSAASNFDLFDPLPAPGVTSIGVSSGVVPLVPIQPTTGTGIQNNMATSAPTDSNSAVNIITVFSY